MASGIKKQLQEHIQEALTAVQLPPVSVEVEYGRGNHADYATGVALKLAQQQKKDPLEIAKNIQEVLQTRLKDYTIQVAPPGFINFHLPHALYTQKLENIRKGNLFTQTKKGEHLLLEYMSPNLFKPLHVGNLVGAIVGESLARIAQICGDTVTRLSYPADIGLPVAKAVWGLKTTNADPHNITALGEAYSKAHEAYENDEKKREEIRDINTALYKAEDKELIAIKEAGKHTSLQHAETLATKMGIQFDGLIFESEAALPGAQLVQEHIQDGIFEEDDGAIIYRGEKEGLHTRVFINREGLPTYEAKEIGNFALKKKRFPQAEKVWVVTGSEQKEYFSVISVALQKVFRLKEQALEHIATGFLTLSEGKMSSRKGNVLTADEVVETLQKEAERRSEQMRSSDKEQLANHIAIAALKYRILRHKAGANIVFDIKQAFSFEGDSGPYLQYTFARTCSILKNAKEQGLTGATETPLEEITALERLLPRFQEAIELSYNDRSPHHLITYLTALSATFNTFYAKERILGTAKDGAQKYRIALTEAVHETLKKGLWLLAIEAPEEF